jgi:adenylate kinase family enzyme
MRIAIIGNSGSGKSTLASRSETPTLDLDTLVWEPNKVAVPRDPEIVIADLEQYCKSHSNWIIEGCYANYRLLRIPKTRPVRLCRFFFRGTSTHTAT